MQIPFTKMHGLGNDFMVLDRVSHQFDLNSETIRHLANRHFGIGFDQLLIVDPPSEPQVDFNYVIYNSDGDEVEHCGNGARCFARFVQEHNLSQKNPLKVKTQNRVLTLETQANGEVTVDMQAPNLDPASVPFLTDEQALDYRRHLVIAGSDVEMEFCALSMGNPHAVIQVEDLSKTAVKDIGEALGNHPDFPEGVNVGFMQVLDRQTIAVRVFERGAGETLACGTGACAAVVAGCLLDLIDATVSVRLRGGELCINWEGDQSPVLMTGPATTVYEGTIEL